MEVEIAYFIIGLIIGAVIGWFIGIIHARRYYLEE